MAHCRYPTTAEDDETMLRLNGKGAACKGGRRSAREVAEPKTGLFLLCLELSDGEEYVPPVSVHHSGSCPHAFIMPQRMHRVPTHASFLAPCSLRRIAVRFRLSQKRLLRRIIDDLAAKVASSQAAWLEVGPDGRAVLSPPGDVEAPTAPSCSSKVAAWCVLPLPLLPASGSPHRGSADSGADTEPGAAGGSQWEPTLAGYNAHVKSTVTFGSHWLLSDVGRSTLRGAVKLAAAPCVETVGLSGTKPASQGLDCVRLVAGEGVPSGSEAFAVIAAAALDAVRCCVRCCRC